MKEEGQDGSQETFQSKRNRWLSGAKNNKNNNNKPWDKNLSRVVLEALITSSHLHKQKHRLWQKAWKQFIRSRWWIDILVGGERGEQKSKRRRKKLQMNWSDWRCRAEGNCWYSGQQTQQDTQFSKLRSCKENCISVANLEDLMNQQFNTDFPDCTEYSCSARAEGSQKHCDVSLWTAT